MNPPVQKKGRTMPDKMLSESNWKTELQKNKTIKDNGLQKLLAAYAHFSEEDTSERRDTCDDISAKALALKKDKAVMALPLVVKYLDGVVAACVNEKKKITADMAKYGMKKIKVQFLVTNWDDEPMQGFEAFVEFKAPGSPTVTLKQPISGGVVSFNDVSLPPSGTVRLMAVSTHGAALVPQAVTSYDLPHAAIMKFQAKQNAMELKKAAKSLKEATQKAGVKGTVGVDYKIVKVGGEVSGEVGDRQSFEEDVEFVIKVAKDTFTMKQL
jgi:hypothetical protein